MSLQYVLSTMRRRKLRTFIIALALTVGVALVGALLALVDTQRQFSTQTIGAQTGGYDLSISRSDLASTPFFNPDEVLTTARAAYASIASAHPRVAASIEARKVGALDGQAVTMVGLDTAKDTLVTLAESTGGQSGNRIFGIRIGGGGPGGPGGGRGQGGPPGGGPAGPPGGGGGATAVRIGGAAARRTSATVGGVFPPAPGQVFLDSSTAGLLGVKIGDELQLSYSVPARRETGKSAISGASTPRITARFLVAGIGVLDGLGTSVSNPVIMRLPDAQAWLGEGTPIANQMLLVWSANARGSTDTRATVSQARDVGEALRDTLQAKLGPDYTVSLPKYTSLEASSQVYAFAQTFITLYGLLSMGIIGLMVNALMTTTVAEQKYDLAILRVLGAPRSRLFNVVVLEVFMLGVVGLVLGILLGRVINDTVIVPLLAANLNLPAGVSPDWTLQTVLIPTAITAGVLTLATISPARAAAATKVMVVLNPAAADQPTLDDLAKLRERRASSSLLITGLVLVAFASVILIVLPTIFQGGNQTGQIWLLFGSLLLMVIGISLLFYFVTTPLERLLIWLYQIISPMAGYFAGRYALRGKGRNALISLMVVMSGVLPTLLSTQLALQEANLATDARFETGAPLVATTGSNFGGGGGGGPGFQVFRRISRTDANLTAKDIDGMTGQPGIGEVVGIADNLPNITVGDRILLRSATVSLIGVQGDLNKVLYTNLYRFTSGSASALTQLTVDRDAVVISQGLSESLDLHVGDALRIKGTGADHEKQMKIIAVAARLPGFGNSFTRSSNDANRSAVLMHLDTYRELQVDPATTRVDPSASVLTKLMATTQPDVDESALLHDLRDYLGAQTLMTVRASSEQVAQARNALSQGRIFTVLLTGLSMVTAIFGVLAVMYTAVMARRIEIGMLKAVGASKGALRGIFIGEAVITTLAAGVAGIVAGTLLGYTFEGSQRLQNDRIFLLGFDFVTAGLIVVMVCIAAVISASMATQPVIRKKAIAILRER